MKRDCAALAHRLILLIPALLCLHIGSGPDGQARAEAATTPSFAGTLDHDFGDGGRVSVDTGDAGAPGLAVRPDGTLLVAANSGRGFVLAHYRASGELDPTFGTGGSLTVPFFQRDDLVDSRPAAFLFQPDGKVVVAGTVRRLVCGRPCPLLEAIGVSRYDAEGAPDPGFGTTGSVTTTLQFGSATVGALALQPDGKLLVLGSTRSITETAPTTLLLRYTELGSPDATFGAGGVVEADFGGGAGSALALQPDGKVVVAGTTAFVAGSSDFMVRRYNADGTVDLGFGSGGGAVADLGTRDVATAVLVQQDERIVVAGRSGGDALSSQEFGLARFLPGGASDATFGGGGKVVTAIGSGIAGEQVYALLQQQDGKLIAVGSAGTSFYDDFALVRYDAGGRPDPTFGADGVVTTDFYNGFIDNIGDRAYAALVQPDGKIIAAGPAMQGEYQGRRYIGLARYLGDPAGVAYLPVLSTR